MLRTAAMKHLALIDQTRFDRLSVPLRAGFSVARSGHPEPVEGCYA
jgi:hypothetical protein